MRGLKRWCVLLAYAMVLTALMVQASPDDSSEGRLGAAYQPQAAEAFSGRSLGLMPESISRRMSRAQELASAENYQGAIQLIEDYLARGSMPDVFRAQFLQNLAGIYAQAGNTEKAAEKLREADQLAVLPLQQTQSLLMLLAQMEIANQRYSAAKQVIDRFFRITEEPLAPAYVLAAIPYSQAGEKQEALRLVEHAIELAKDPQENWLLFAVGLNFENKNWDRCVELMEKLTAMNPSKGLYWKQLAGIYVNKGANDKALSTLELAARQGYLENSSEWVNLAALRLDRGQPLQAAQLLEKKIKAGQVKASRRHWETVADAYMMAREPDLALAAMTKASQFEGDGKVLAKKGQLLMEREEWSAAAEALSEALKRGGVSQPKQLHLGLGISYYYQDDFQNALKHFRAALKQDDEFKAAQQWVSYLEGELSVAAESF